jgi:hypothetical protein
MEIFLSDVYSVLQEKGFKEHCHHLNALLRTVETNSKLVRTKIRFYKWSGLFLLTSIPLVSALVSVSVGLEGKDATGLGATLKSLSLPLSLLLTVVTILNSIFRPSERFRQACLLGIGIDAFKANFLVTLERLEKVDERALLDLVDEKRKGTGGPDRTGDSSTASGRSRCFLAGASLAAAQRRRCNRCSHAGNA